jgi:hypothetical protein
MEGLLASLSKENNPVYFYKATGVRLGRFFCLNYNVYKTAC